ncbi:MAG: GntR family transcriptional regulator, partial [Gemmataceae bacterium]
GCASAPESCALTADWRQSTITLARPPSPRPLIYPLQTIHEQIASRLRGELWGGRLKPGEPLREVPLAARYGVSRATVRQAFGQLVQEGLLVSRRNCGVRVAPPPPAVVRDLLIPMRVTAEAYALRACLPRLTADDFREWERLLARLRVACDEADYAAAVERDFDFHRHLMALGGLTDLLPLWTTLIAKTHAFYRHRELDPRALPAVHLMHAELLALFRAGDEPAAVQALTEHILDGDFNERVRQQWASRSAERWRR